jgi:hypothetical protein
MEYHNSVWDECQPMEEGWANVYNRGWCYYIGKIYRERAKEDRTVGLLAYRINIRVKEQTNA